MASSWLSRPTSLLSPSVYSTSLAPFLAHFRAQALPSALAFFAPQVSSVIQPLQLDDLASSAAKAIAPTSTNAMMIATGASFLMDELLRERLTFDDLDAFYS